MERISALMDGELDRQQASSLLPDMRQQGELREAWATYHLIGEALRGQSCPDSRVAELVSRRLATEPTVLAPRPHKAGFARKWAWPSIAAAAAVATVTWMATGIQGPASVPGGGFQSAGFQATPVLGPPAGISNAVATFTEIVPSTPAGAQGSPQTIQLTAEGYQPYLMAHQPFSPSMSIQGLAPYMRTVGAGAAER